VIELVENYLGEPAYRREGVTIFQGDSLELMKRIKEPIVDLTVTSPPYNIGKEYETIRDIDDYVEWCASWMSEIHRITKLNGGFWLNLGYFEFPHKGKAVPIPYLLWDKSPFYLIQEVIWNYGAGVANKRMFSPRNEKFLWFVKDPGDYVFNLDDVRDTNVKYPYQKKNGKLKCNPRGKNPTDVWSLPKVTSGTNRSSQERTTHPAQFPAAVIQRIVKACSRPSEIIFDPFMGSGTVAEVAIQTDRKAIGIEIRDDYIQIIANRIDKYLKRKELQEAQEQLF
jgi:adenine-specific DNA-methyltransferase